MLGGGAPLVGVINVLVDRILVVSSVGFFASGPEIGTRVDRDDSRRRRTVREQRTTGSIVRVAVETVVRLYTVRG